MAYYSNQGLAIHSGAAGLTAYRDGSLGALGADQDKLRQQKLRQQKLRQQQLHSIYSLYAPRAGRIGYGPSSAFKDGSLGEGPLRTYQDGSLGMPLFLETAEGIQQMEEPVTIYHGSMGEYFSGTAGCRGCGQTEAVLVAAPAPAAGPVLDLSNPAAALEVKSMLFMAPWMLQAAAEARYHSEMENPVWTALTVELQTAWVSGYVEFMYAQAQPPPVKKAAFLDFAIASSFEGTYYTPNSFGVRNIYFGATLGAASVGADVAKSYPVVTKYLNDDTAAGSTGVVSPPVTEGSLPAGKKKPNYLMVGAGVAALAVLGMAFMKKGKK